MITKAKASNQTIYALGLCTYLYLCACQATKPEVTTQCNAGDAPMYCSISPDVTLFLDTMSSVVLLGDSLLLSGNVYAEGKMRHHFYFNDYEFVINQPTVHFDRSSKSVRVIRGHGFINSPQRKIDISSGTLLRWVNGDMVLLDLEDTSAPIYVKTLLSE